MARFNNEIPIPTRLVKTRKVKRKGVGGRRINEYKDEHGNWYNAAQLGKFYGVTGNTIRNRIEKNGYKHKNILKPLVKKGFRLDGSKISNKGKSGNAAWDALDDIKVNRHL